MTKIENQYRQISLLTNYIEKQFEHLLQQEIGKKIANYQFGFKENYSTFHPVTIISTNIQKNRIVGNYSAAVFFYIKKGH